MTTQQLNLLAVIGIAVCWGVVVLAWLAGAIYYQSREPAERTRASYLSPLLITTVIMVVVSAAVPMADWRPLEVHAPWVRLLGLAIVLAATALTLWARLAPGCDVDGRAHGQAGASAAYQRAVRRAGVETG